MGMRARTWRSRTGPDASLTMKHIATMAKKRAAVSAPTTPKRDNGSRGRFVFTLTPASVMRSSTDAQTMHNVPSLQQCAAVDVPPDRHPRRQRVRAHDVEDALRLVEILGQRVVVQRALHGADRQPGAEGQPEAGRQADPGRPAPRDEPGHQCERDVDLGQPQLRRSRSGVEQAAAECCSGRRRASPPRPACPMRTSGTSCSLPVRSQWTKSATTAAASPSPAIPASTRSTDVTASISGARAVSHVWSGRDRVVAGPAQRGGAGGVSSGGRRSPPPVPAPCRPRQHPSRPGPPCPHSPPTWPRRAARRRAPP